MVPCLCHYQQTSLITDTSDKWYISSQVNLLNYATIIVSVSLGVSHKYEEFEKVEKTLNISADTAIY